MPRIPKRVARPLPVRALERPSIQHILDNLRDAQAVQRVSQARPLDVPFDVSIRMTPIRPATLAAVRSDAKARNTLPVAVSAKLASRALLDALQAAEPAILDWLDDPENAAAFVVDPLAALQELRGKIAPALLDMLAAAGRDARRSTKDAPGVDLRNVVVRLDRRGGEVIR